MYGGILVVKRLLWYWSFVVTLGLAPIVIAETGSIRIIDEHGLVRAVKAVSASASVVIELGPKFDGTQELSLINVDGLQPERQGTYISGKSVSFSGINAGTWRITGGQNPISKVTITPEG